MSEIDSKRCFECGATYGTHVHNCQHDGAPLCPSLLGGHWQVEGVLAARPAGGRFAAFHITSGTRVAIDYLPPDAAAVHVERLQREVQARGLLSHPVAPRILEEGGERDGAVYFVSELGTARTLQDILEENPRPSTGMLSAGNLGILARPLLGLLSAAHRMGIAHGTIDLPSIVLTSDDDFALGLDRAGGVKLHGLQLLGLGAELRSAAQQDLRKLASVFYEVLIGQRPPLDGDQAELLRSSVESLGAAGQILLRALGVGPAAEFSNADEFLRALIATFGPMPQPPTSELPGSLSQTDPTLEKISLPSQPSIEAVRKGSFPTPTALPALPPPPSGPGMRSPGSVRLSGAHAVLPAPLAALSNPGMPQRSGLTGELKQISIHDLMAEEAQPKRDETLARSRDRASLDNLAIPTVLPPGGWHAADAPSQPGILSSGEHSALDRTADLNALPIDYSSQISGRIVTGSAAPSEASSLVSAPHPLAPPAPAKSVVEEPLPTPASVLAPHPSPVAETAALREVELARAAEPERVAPPAVEKAPPIAAPTPQRPTPPSKPEPTQTTAGGPPIGLWIGLLVAALLIGAAALILLRR